MSLGEILSELRGDKGLTQQQLSEQLHISNSSISAYETGSRLPNVETLALFAKFFNVTTDYLLGLTKHAISPSALSEEFIDGAKISSVLEMLKMLTPAQKRAILLVIENMKLCTVYTELTGKKSTNGADME